MKYTLIEQEIKDCIEIYIQTDSNDADYISTINSYDINNLEDKFFLLCVKAMQDLYSLRQGHDLENCFKLWSEMYDARVVDYLQGYITEYLDIPRNDWDYCFCHTLCDFRVTIYKGGKKYDLEIDMPDNLELEEE